MELEQTLPAVAVMERRIDELRMEIRELAEQGDTLGCDIRHGWIGTLESASAILVGEGK